MAKQSGIHGLRGKVNGMSYYSSKNGGALVRTINEGLGQRVKDAKEYINTRKNNAEFGSAGSLAGAIIKPISLRWRFILDSNGTGKLVKVIKEALLQDTASPWGQRVVPLTTMPHIQDVFNSFSKNEMPAEIANALQNNVTYNSVNGQLSISDGGTITSDVVQQMSDKGATHYSAKVFALNVRKPIIGPDGVNYLPASTVLKDMTDDFGAEHSSLSVGSEFLSTGQQNISVAALNGDSHLGGVLVVFLPERKVGNEYYTLQELCSAYWCPAKAAE